MLPLDKTSISKHAALYDNRAQGNPDELGEKLFVDWFSQHKYLDKPTFIALRKWKSTMGLKTAEKNSPEFVEEATRFALSAKTEEARVEVLRTLKGVDYPVASVILHFAFPDQYSILDFRAIESLGWDAPKHQAYDFQYWMRYTFRIREIASQTGLPIRTIDKALWEYSKQKSER